MANLTITVDDLALKWARIRALEQGTSVNAVLRDFLSAHAGAQNEQVTAAKRILDLARRSNTWSRPDGLRWPRDEIHDGP